MTELILIIVLVFLVIASLAVIAYLIITKPKDQNRIDYVMFDFDALLKTLNQTNTSDDVVSLVGFEPIVRKDDEMIYNIKEMNSNTYTKYVLKFKDGKFESSYKVYGLTK